MKVLGRKVDKWIWSRICLPEIKIPVWNDVIDLEVSENIEDCFGKGAFVFDMYRITGRYDYEKEEWEYEYVGTKIEKV